MQENGDNEEICVFENVGEEHFICFLKNTYKNDTISIYDNDLCYL